MSDSETWYEHWFDRDEYEIVYRHRDDEEAVRVIDLIERSATPATGARIVDVGCGRGRHALALANRGYAVTGLDISERSIEAARRRAAEEDLNVTFVVADMREPLPGAPFDGAVNLFTAFGYFVREAEHMQAIRAIASMLPPDGWFFQDFLNPEFVRSTLVPEDRRQENNIEIVQRRSIRKGRIQKEILLKRDGETHRFYESVRLLELAQFETLYDAAGLRMESVYGDYDGGDYGPESPRMIMLSRKVSGGS